MGDVGIMARKILKGQRTQFQKVIAEHSTALYWDEQQKVIQNLRSSSCMSMITYGEKQITECFQFCRKSSQDVSKSWHDYLINRSCFSSAYITKDVKEGYKTGFELDCTVDRAMFQGAIIAFRHPVEFEYWDFDRFVDEGFSEDEAFALATNFVVEGGEIRPAGENSNHVVVNRYSPFEAYLGKHYSPCGESFSSGVKSYAIQTSFRWYAGKRMEFDFNSLAGAAVAHKNIFGHTHMKKPISATKENMQKLLEMMKG